MIKAKIIGRSGKVKVLFLGFAVLFSNLVWADKDVSLSLRVRKEGLNLRTDSTVASQVITKLRRGERLVGVGKLYEWYKVKIPERVKVYLYKKYTRLQGGRVEVIADRVNVRSGPGLSYAVLGQANTGDRFELCREQVGGDWVCVLAGDHRLYGWVHERGVESVSVNKEKRREKQVKEEKEEGIVKERGEEIQLESSQTGEKEVEKKTTSGQNRKKEKEEKKDLPIARGIVREMGRVLGVKYRYKLVDRKGKILYYLSGEREMLSSFVNRDVFVFGEVSGVAKDIPVLSVRKIALVRIGLEED